MLNRIHRIAALLSVSLSLGAITLPAAANPNRQPTEPAQATTKSIYLGSFTASCYYDGHQIVVNWHARPYQDLLSVVKGKVTTALGESQYLGGLPDGVHVGGQVESRGQLTFDVGPGLPVSLNFLEFSDGEMVTLSNRGILPDTLHDCTYAPE